MIKIYGNVEIPDEIHHLVQYYLDNVNPDYLMIEFDKDHISKLTPREYVALFNTVALAINDDLRARRQVFELSQGIDLKLF